MLCVSAHDDDGESTLDSRHSRAPLGAGQPGISRCRLLGFLGIFRAHILLRALPTYFLGFKPRARVALKSSGVQTPYKRHYPKTKLNTACSVLDRVSSQ